MRKASLAILFLALVSNGFGWARDNNPPRNYSVLGGVVGSLAGLGIGGILGGVALSSKADDCSENSNPEGGDLCGLFVLAGMGAGAGIGYSLGVPVGGHFKAGLFTREFAINFAAMAVLTGMLAFSDYKMYQWQDEKSLNITIPLSLVIPQVSSYWLGNSRMLE